MSAQPPAAILCIEDDDAVRRSMVAYLEDRGFRTLEADNGMTGLEVFARQKPDLVLLDLRMPQMNGLDVLAKLTESSPDTPVIVVSGTGLVANAVEALHLGAWDYLLKPIEDLGILLHAVQAALERAALVRENRKYQEHLEEEIARRTAQLEKTNDELRREVAERRRAEKDRERVIAELEAKNAELERFTYTVSHDLKSPLITIKGFLGVLAGDVAAGDRARIDEDLRAIAGAADRMFAFLGDLLDLSRIGRLAGAPEETPMGELVGEAIEAVTGAIGRRDVQITIDPDLPALWGDRKRLVEVFQNLIENAIKYAREDARPEIQIGAVWQNDQVVCHVRDNGRGIDPRYHDKIFGLFEQLDPACEGTGVGLALVKRIVEVHGGRVWVESAGEGQGAAFYVALPPRPSE